MSILYQIFVNISTVLFSFACRDANFYACFAFFFSAAISEGAALCIFEE